MDKDKQLWGAAACILVILSLCLLIVSKSTNDLTLTTHGDSYKLIKAVSDQELQRGLGGRLSLPSNQGMLFVFRSEDIRCFWMKDMHFPLDIIWLNNQKEVVALEANILPKTYPETFCPPVPAEYVIELNSGQASNAGIVQGSKLSF